MDKVWEIKDPEAYLKKKKTHSTPRPELREQKDPAKAYSLSMFYWGGGQLYNDQLEKGVAFLVSQLLVLAGVVLLVIYDDELLQFLRERRISLSDAFLAGEIMLFLVILFWASNAADAYRTAARARKARFPGVSSRVTPCLGSLLAPGWGQFLNGQPIKGTLFSVLAVMAGFSVFSAVLTYLAWPRLDGGDTLFIIEEISAVSLLITPLAPLLWIFSAYDAFKVSNDELLKEPLWERIKAAYYRGRTQGIVAGIIPQIKGTAILILVLACLMIVVHYWFPTGFYAGFLRSVQRLLAERGMTIVPSLIENALSWMT